ncbi:hypothetical protein CEXT_206091 [Caerostris extrusa]|uniref:Uncharacterized protein n=1 Tax=Caerostris extrusa TaxID=172846 RepID=A0AAV4XLC4_CAEEX|nr:hypothetical protein CEXT_206091 [Caerostris extrusa]
MGVYSTLFEKFSGDGKPPGFFMKAAIGMAAGAVGAFVGTPAEISLIRMTADGSKQKHKENNSNSVLLVFECASVTTFHCILFLWLPCAYCNVCGKIPIAMSTDLIENTPSITAKRQLPSRHHLTYSRQMNLHESEKAAIR